MVPGFLDNPDINATLFFSSDLSIEPAPPHLISPAPASTYAREGEGDGGTARSTDGGGDVEGPVGGAGKS